MQWLFLLIDHGVVEFGHALDLHVAMLELSLVILLQQDGADEAGDAVLVGEDAGDIGAALYLLGGVLERVGRV